MWMTQASRVVRYYTQSLLICAVLFYGPKPIFAQGRQEPSTPGSVNSEQEAGTEPEDPRAAQTLSTPAKSDSEGKQPKRILWIIPNYRAVSPNTQLPGLRRKTASIIRRSLLRES